MVRYDNAKTDRGAMQISLQKIAACWEHILIEVYKEVLVRVATVEILIS